MTSQEEVDVKLAFDARIGDLNRGRALAVGVNLNGITEVIIRQNNSQSAWVVLRNSEVVDLIHLLATTIGYCVSLQPRDKIVQDI